MKNLIKLGFVIVLTSCATQKTVELANGNFVTERQYNRMIKNSYKKAIKQMSKEDRKIIKSTKIIVETE